MKLLFTSTECDEISRLVQRLLLAYIPCALCKDATGPRLSIWVQQDIDLPSALHVLATSKTPRRLPHWARALDLPQSPSAAHGASDTAKSRGRFLLHLNRSVDSMAPDRALNPTARRNSGVFALSQLALPRWGCCTTG